MKAELLAKDRYSVAEGRFVSIVVWRVPQAVLPSLHPFKYRLAYVVDGVCVVRYDNEAGKGDRKHSGTREVPYAFTSSLDRLLDDFRADVSERKG